MISDELVTRALDEVRRSDSYAYFFDQLTSPDWIEPLRSKGFFQRPPSMIRDGDSVRFELWPESRYLARVAVQAPDLVIDVITPLADTDNVRVQEDFADAAVAMDPASAVRIAPLVKGWLSSPYQLLLPDKAGNLVVRLANGGYVSEAMDLAREIFWLSIVDRSEVGDLGFPVEVTSRIDSWQYPILLKKIESQLDLPAMQSFIRLLVDLLRAAVEIASEDVTYPSDDSYSWRPCIEDSEQNWQHSDLKSDLVVALRDACAKYVGEDRERASEVVDELCQEQFVVFRRVALHLAGQIARTAPEIASRLLVDCRDDSDLGAFHEYWLLASRTFLVIGEGVRDSVLSIIGDGPSEMHRGFLESLGDGRERYIRTWQLKRLAILSRVNLPDEWKSRFDELVDELGIPEHPEYINYSSGMRTGPNSPKSSEDLLAFSDDDLIGYLTTWEPSNEWMGDSPEGLARAIGGAVHLDPSRLAQLAPRFQAQDPTYVRGYLFGFYEVAKSERTFEWRGILELGRWVLDQPADGGLVDAAFDRDIGWHSSRQTLAQILRNGLVLGPNQIPYEYRPMVWELIAKLVEDADPTEAMEARYGGSNMGPLTLSLNTVRGAAMHALVSYALWVKQSVVSDGKNRAAWAAEEIDEVWKCLNHHLDPAVDPSLAVRSVYGKSFPQLTHLSRNWASEHVNEIFPPDLGDHAMWSAAWGAYINYSRVFTDVTPLLLDQYAIAISRLREEHEGGAVQDAPNGRHLAQHLMVLYWQQTIELVEPAHLLPAFWRDAPSDVRSQALSFVGLSLRNHDGPLSQEIQERLVALWEMRASQLAAMPSDDAREEWAAFSWWFASGKFEETWSFENLNEALKAGGRIDGSHMVLERLEALVGSHASECVATLKLLAEPPNDEWGMIPGREETRTILAAGLASPDPIVRDATTTLINAMGARGARDLGSLLDTGR